jgi:hypothetical protein
VPASGIGLAASALLDNKADANFPDGTWTSYGASTGNHRIAVAAGAAAGHRAVRGALPGQSPRQFLDEVPEIMAADRMVQRASAVSEQLAGHCHALHRDRAGCG